MSIIAYSPVNSQSWEMYQHTHTCTSVLVSVCHYVILTLLIFQLTTTRFMIVCSFLVFTSFSNSEKRGSHFPQYMYYTHEVVPELLTFAFVTM